jgi:group I intron endonuclease
MITPEELVLKGISELDKCGVYLVYCKENKKGYIGHTQTRFSKRLSDHRNYLKRNKHTNQILQSSWNKYGPEAFIFIPIEIIKQDSAVHVFLEREEFYIKTIPEELRFNIVLEPTKNVHISREVREKMSKSHFDSQGNYIVSAAKKEYYESLKGAGNPMYGKTHSKETREKIKEANKNKTSTSEQIEKMAAAVRGKKQTLEHIAKRMAKRKETLKTKTISEEEHKRRSEAHKGYKFTEERKKEYSLKFKGENNPRYNTKHSEETKKLIGAKTVGRGPAISLAKRKNSTKRLLNELLEAHKNNTKNIELENRITKKYTMIREFIPVSLNSLLTTNEFEPYLACIS